MAILGERTILAATALAILEARGEQPTERLAVLVGQQPDVLLDALLPLAAAGWVGLSADGASVRSRHPSPAPTLQEVLVVESERAVVDDCVLRPGTACGAFDGPSTCAGHADWTATLAQSALAVVPVALAVATLGAPTGGIGGSPVRLRSILEPWAPDATEATGPVAALEPVSAPRLVPPPEEAPAPGPASLPGPAPAPTPGPVSATPALAPGGEPAP